MLENNIKQLLIALLDENKEEALKQVEAVHTQLAFGLEIEGTRVREIITQAIMEEENKIWHYWVEQIFNKKEENV